MRWRIPKPNLGLEPDNKRMFWGMFFNEAGLGVFITLFPIFIASLGASPSQIGLVIGFWGLARLIALLPSGMLIERVPPRRLILIARVMAIAGFILMFLAQEWWHLFPGILLMSASSASFPVISTVIADVAGRGRARARAFTLIFNVGPSVALLVTPALGGILAEQISLRSIFAAAAIFNVAALAVFALVSHREVKLIQGPPVTYRETFTHAATRTILILAFVAVLAMVTGVTLIPNFLQEVHNVSISQVGYLGSFAAVGSITLGLMLNKIKLFENPMLGFSLALGTVGLGLVLFTFGNAIWIFGLAYMMRGGLLATFSVMYASLTEVTPDRIRNRTYVVAELMAGSGFAFGPFIAGWFYDIDPVLPFAIGIAILIPVISVVLVLSQRLVDTDTDSTST
jgi:MFS family permease